MAWVEDWMQLRPVKDFIGRGGGHRAVGQRLVFTGALLLTLGAVACTGSNNNSNSSNNSSSNASATRAATVSVPAATAGTAAGTSSARQATPAAAGTSVVRPSTAAAGTSVARPSTAAAGTAATGTAAARTGTPASGAATPGASASGTPSGAAANIPLVTITAKDFSFDAPDTITAGLTHLRMQNTGKEDHQAQFLRVNDGITLPQIQAALQQGPDKVLSLISAQGGPNTAPPGSTTDVVEDLRPGQYLLVCFVTGSDNIPHIIKGMVKPVQVTGTSDGQAALAPAQGTVTMREFSYEYYFGAPGNLPAGPTTLKATNSGTQPHEMTVVKLNSGVTADQVKASFSPNAPPPSGPPPFTSVGGVAGIAPGESSETTLNLTPGDYAMICFIADINTGAPHAALGMVGGFTVK